MLNKNIFRISIVFAIILAVVLIFGGYEHYLLCTEIQPKSEINILSFWKTHGESKALNALINEFIKHYPNTIVIPTSIVDRDKYLFDVMSLLTSRHVPDVFLMHAGYEGLPYYNAGLLNPVDDIWESENLESVIPSVVREMNKFDNHYYSVPLNIHRVNIIWYNKELVDKNKIDVTTLVDWDTFFDACDKLKLAGITYPIQMGESWTSSHVFEQIVASEGIDFYQDWINGKIISAYDSRFLNALTTFKKYIMYTNQDYKKLNWNDYKKLLWNDSLTKVISGESAFMIMGDWANQEFKIAGKKYNIDYGSFPVPGTENVYGLCIDTFQRPKNISDPINADLWLKTVVSRTGQDTFNPIKGSISARTDADASKYDKYQRTAMYDFSNAMYMFPSVVHGSGAPQAYKIKMEHIISEFLIHKDPIKASAELANYSVVIQDEYTTVWTLY